MRGERECVCVYREVKSVIGGKKRKGEKEKKMRRGWTVVLPADDLGEESLESKREEKNWTACVRRDGCAPPRPLAVPRQQQTWQKGRGRDGKYSGRASNPKSRRARASPASCFSSG